MKKEREEILWLAMLVISVAILFAVIYLSFHK